VDWGAERGTFTPVWEGVNGPETVPLNFVRKGWVIARPFDSKLFYREFPALGNPGDLPTQTTFKEW
jgi:hypothetical protein